MLKRIDSEDPTAPSSSGGWEKTRGCSAVVGLLIALCVIGCSSEGDQSATANRRGDAGVAVNAYSGPAVSDFAIWRPFVELGEFEIAPDRIRSTAFAVRLDGEDRPVVMIPLHPALQLLEPVVDREAAQSARSGIRKTMIAEAFGAETEMRRLDKVVDLEAPSVLVGDSLTHDLLIVSPGATARRLRPLTLAANPARVGDVVWMATAVYRGAPASQVGHPATVTRIDDDGRMAYRFLNESLSLYATDGAPLLDDAGHVVGVHLGPTVDEDTVGEEPDEAVTGFGVTASEVRAAWGREVPGAEEKN
ncbi:hypothetical protein Mal15_62010 [Stieleria maiorica]|uniref:Trypsin n=1 Tax=Stieleria maiorica TaxID=2795974 RepID=A0A5B9MSW1_9BACT|nr:trypsin-like peptidase domain-containing protein [Stieleria maiorica]QEG02118.1 hypothetical protein Mal15_62010 [Stieleria maiorica]